MMMRVTLVSFAGLTLIFYALFTVPALVIAGIDHTPVFFLFACIHELVAFGVALELAELCLATLLTPRRHPLSTLSQREPRVAALYVCCDDVDPEALVALHHLESADVFVLDDSQRPDMRARADQSGFVVIRRGDTVAFKAGNLNHWLRLHAWKYRYFLVLDADSIVSNEALQSLVRHAEHPANRDVAIVQSTIVARPGNRFQQCVGGHAVSRAQVLARLHDRIGWSISHGHNNLHRTAALRHAGGFDVTASCEDTMTSLRLLSLGWRIILVDAVTHAAEPVDVFAYRRRSVRWARQTVDAILVARRVNTKHALLLARHLFGHLMPGAWLAALTFLFLAPWRSLSPGSIGTVLDLALSPHLMTLTSMLWVGMGIVLGLRLCHWRTAGLSLRRFLSFTALSGALVAFTSLHIASGLLRSLLVDAAAFLPTGAGPRGRANLSTVWCGMLLPWTIAAAAAVTMVGGRPPTSAITVASLVGLMAAPGVLWWFHRDQMEGRPG